MNDVGTPPRALSEVSVPDLRSLQAALAADGIPELVTVTSLQARGLGHLASALQPYLGLTSAALSAVVGAVLAERHYRRAPKLTLVWTGDDPGIGHSRYTRIVLPELFSQARKHVLIAGYSFDRGAELFEPLHQVMATHDATATLFVDVHQLIDRLKNAAKSAKKDWGVLALPMQAAATPEDRGQAAISLFYELMWPFGYPRPRIYFDPRTATPFGLVSLHAKCVVIDHHLALITSANFTNRGQTRNFEAGVAIEDRAFATTLERQWANLVDAGVVIEGLHASSNHPESP